MKKKILAAVICAALICALLPGTSLAAARVIAVAHDGTNYISYTSFEMGWNEAMGTNNTANTAVKLLANWTADASTHLFGTGDGFSNGRISVPKYKTVRLDLGGFDIDRHMPSAINLGECITVLGTLTILDSSTTLTANQGRITGGWSGWGGGVNVSSGSFTTGNKVDAYAGNVTLLGGRITGNKADNGGAGVFLNGSNTPVFTVSGGEITGNTCTNANGGGGGVRVFGGTFNVSGAAKISGNTGGNVYLNTGKTITVTGALTTAASIGVTTQTPPANGAPVAITGASSGDYSARFSSDNTDYIIANSGTGSAQIVQLKTNAPAVTSPSADQNVPVAVGSPVTLAVTAENALGYQWRINRGSGFTDIAGATGASYTIPVVALEHNGFQYVCTVHGVPDTESATSHVFTLRVTDGVPSTGDSGQPVLLLCALILSAAALVFTAYRRKASN